MELYQREQIDKVEGAEDIPSDSPIHRAYKSFNARGVKVKNYALRVTRLSYISHAIIHGRRILLDHFSTSLRSFIVFQNFTAGIEYSFKRTVNLLIWIPRLSA